jgi:hypothetical protein
LLSRLAFRGIYFPQMKRRDWLHVLYENRGPILSLLGQAMMLKLKPQRRKAIVLEPQVQVEPAPLASEQMAG